MFLSSVASWGGFWWIVVKAFAHLPARLCKSCFFQRGRSIGHVRRVMGRSRLPSLCFGLYCVSYVKPLRLARSGVVTGCSSSSVCFVQVLVAETFLQQN